MDSLGGPIGGAWTSAEGGPGEGALGLLKRRPLSSSWGSRSPMAIAVSNGVARVPSSSEGLRPTMEPWPTRGKAGWSVSSVPKGWERWSRCPDRISAPRLSTTSPVPSRGSVAASLRPSRGPRGDHWMSCAGEPPRRSTPGLPRLSSLSLAGLTRRPSHHVQKLGTTAAWSTPHSPPGPSCGVTASGAITGSWTQSILEGPLFSVTDHRGGLSASCPIRCPGL